MTDVPGDDPPSEEREGTVKKAARARVDAWRTVGTLGTVGLSFVFAIAIGSFLGLQAGKFTGWPNTCFFVGFLLGLAAGILNVYRSISQLPK